MRKIQWFELTQIVPRSKGDKMHAYHDIVEHSVSSKEDLVGYSVNHLDHRMAQITIRQRSPFTTVPSVKHEVEIEVGTELSLTGLICPLSSRGNRKADPVRNLPARKVVHFEVPEEKVESWIINAFAQKGLSVQPDALIYSDPELLLIGKKETPGASFPVRRVWVTGTVTDIDLAETLLLKGIGKRRAYGAGVMYVEPN